jgi:hypothetical protein
VIFPFTVLDTRLTSPSKENQLSFRLLTSVLGQLAVHVHPCTSQLPLQQEELHLVHLILLITHSQLELLLRLNGSPFLLCFLHPTGLQGPDQSQARLNPTVDEVPTLPVHIHTAPPAGNLCYHHPPSPLHLLTNVHHSSALTGLTTSSNLLHNQLNVGDHLLPVQPLPLHPARHDC